MKTFHKIPIFSFTLILILKAINGLPTVLETNSNDDYCKTCNALVSFAHKLTLNNSDQFLDNAFVNICNDYSALPGQQTTKLCNEIVKAVFNMFKNVNRATFCNEISACVDDNFDASALIEQSSSLSDDVNCDFCQDVATNIKNIISGQSTELEMKYLVEDACHYLGSFENECVSISDEYLDSVFTFIRQSLQPKQLCQAIGACPKSVESNQVKTVADISEVINIFPAQIPLTPLKSAEPIAQNSDVECLLCKRLVKYVIEELKDNRTEEAIISALERVCSLFPSKDRAQCDNFVQQYADELIHILTEETDPEMACTLLGVCVPQSLWKVINLPNVETSNNVESQKPIKWQEIQSSIEVESSDNESESIDSKVDAPKSSKSTACYECELIMHFIQNELYDYNTEEQIEEFVENQLCDRLTIVITKEACDSFIRQYGPQVIQLIAQRLFDPSTVCQKELGLCPNTTQIVKTSQTTESDFSIDQTTQKCELCVSLVQQMDSLLENDQFDKEVAKIVEKTCKTLSQDKQTECELMVEAFAPYFLQMIGRLSNANEICKSIDMCYTAGHVHLLGGHKCTFGPSYWCHTIAHAEACKATHFCKNKVWKATP
jgi:saposin